jgi:hypothetical protein
MRRIGFSTEALAQADLRRGLTTMRSAACSAVEFAVLRQADLFPLLESLETLDLTGFEYISIHLPRQFELDWETLAWGRLIEESWRDWSVVVDPETLFDFSLWQSFGHLLCIDTMDKRKPLGRMAAELRPIFDRLPHATFCFDLGLARLCDPTMAGAHLILREFGPKLSQVRMSEANPQGRRDPVSAASIRAFQEVAHLVPEDVPLILEMPAAAGQIEAEIAKVRQGLPSGSRIRVA